jgi:hypothetical protein
MLKGYFPSGYMAIWQLVRLARVRVEAEFPHYLN